MQKLDDATDVVALLTARSVNRPWILYEAGVAKGKLDANDRVLGIALGISLDDTATGPFAQFQNSPDDEDAITGVVLQLIRRHPQADPREEAVRRQVKAFRDSVAELLKGRRKEPAQSQSRVDETSAAKFFEEIKVLVRDVPERVAGELGTDFRMRRIRRRRFHPMMLEDLLNSPPFREESGRHANLPILLMASMVRDDLPWFYELAVQLYRAMEEGDARAIERSRGALMCMADLMHHGHPCVVETAGGPIHEEAMMILHHTMRWIDHHGVEPRRRRKPQQPPDGAHT